MVVLQVKQPVQVRAGMIKAELSDTEGLGFKLEERQRDIMQLRTALKMKVTLYNNLQFDRLGVYIRMYIS